MAQIVGVVLAGGEGRRLGQPKGQLQVEGQSLAERAVSVVWPFCASVLVSIRAGARTPAQGFPVVEDAPGPGRGPLAGIDAAFRATGTADLLVLACDYPRVDAWLVRRLLALATDPSADLVMVTDSGGRDHPLVGLWRRSAAPAVAEAMERQDYAIRALLPDLRLKRLGQAEFTGADLDQALLNVNWPADLEHLGLAGSVAEPQDDPAPERDGDEPSERQR